MNDGKDCTEVLAECRNCVERVGIIGKPRVGVFTASFRQHINHHVRMSGHTMIVTAFSRHTDQETGHGIKLPLSADESQMVWGKLDQVRHIGGQVEWVVQPEKPR